MGRATLTIVHCLACVSLLCLLCLTAMPPLTSGFSPNRESGDSTTDSTTDTAAECPLISTLLHSTADAVKEDSMCMFAVLSLSTYIYKPDQQMKFMLLSTSRKQIAKYYNVEVVDHRGRAVGQFVHGDNICKSGLMLTHKPDSTADVQFPSKVSFVWRAPDSNQGTLFFRFSVGVQNDDQVSVWLRCDRQTPLKYFEEIPSNILYSIENPLYEHMNHRHVGVALPATPPSPPKVVQEPPTPPISKQQTTVTQLSDNSGMVSRPSFRGGPVLTFPTTDRYIHTDKISWCKPFRAPRFQIIAGTSCRKYIMYPNSQTFFCFPGLIFSVINCGCTYEREDTKCTFP